MDKVLVIGSLSTTGGVSRYIKDLIDNISDDYKITIFDTSHKVKSNIKFEDAGYLTSINAGIPRFVWGLFKMMKNVFSFPFFLKNTNPDIVHVTGLSYGRFWERSYYILVSKISNKPIFYHYLGALDLFYESSNSFSKYLINIFIDISDHISFL